MTDWAPETPRRRNRFGLAISSFVLSLMSLLLFLFMFIMIIMMVAAPIFGSISLVVINVLFYVEIVAIAVALTLGILSINSISGRGFAVAGVCISSVAAIVWIVVLLQMNLKNIL